MLEGVKPKGGVMGANSQPTLRKILCTNKIIHYFTMNVQGHALLVHLNGP